MKLRKRQIRDYFFLFLGVLLIGISSKNIYSPMNLIIGGVSGVSIILNHLIGMPLWLSNTVINIPLFFVGCRVKGWRFIRRTFFATMLLSLLLWLIPDVSIIPKQDLFLSSIFGGIIMGIGSGLIFLAEATSGGTDLLAAIIQKYLRHYTLPQVMQFLDAVIVLWGLQIFGVEHALYAIVSIYVFTRVS
ncbi:MAG: YitT family protein, partial [Oribacterium sp.]